MALSGRALAQAARRAGRPARVIDLFGDADTRDAAERVVVAEGDLERGLDPGSVLAAAERLAPAGSSPSAGVAYGAGLEDRPELIARLSQGRRLRGNGAPTVERAKDPAGLARLLAGLGIPHPEVRLTPPAEPEGWLAKQAGASGGAHVAPAGGDVPEDAYWQRRVAGRTLSVTFLADGRRVRVVGLCQQWTAGHPALPYLFGGVGQPAALGAAARATVDRMAAELTAELGLVGLNGIDLIVDRDERGVWLIEVNPRPGASLDVLDRGELLTRHLAACDGRLPDEGEPLRPASASAASVVYAPLTVRVGGSLPTWTADRPAPGTVIPSGAPICTVRAEASDLHAARRLAARRAREVVSRLVPCPDLEEVPRL